MAETVPERMSLPRRTLGLAGITIHAMTLIAPGAFVWMLFPIQLALGGGRDVWPGMLAALFSAFLTATAFATLARRYPEAGLYSAFHFAQKVFGELGRSSLVRPLKFWTGASAHLFYWVYPGVMIALLTSLTDYLLRQFGSQPTVFGKLILAAAIAGFIGFLALRGINGSMTSSILLNVLQISVLLIFCGAALAFRWLNPQAPPAGGWAYPSAAAILAPSGLRGVMSQASLAIFLVLGFEAVVSLGVAATNPRRDMPRGTILALLVQGLVAYSLQYFAFSYALPAGIASAPAPLGELAIGIGDALFAGNGYTLMLVAAASVIIAGLAAALTALNTGVRTTFAMALDSEMPEYVGLLPAKQVTPTTAVIVLSVLSAGIGLAGALGGLPLLSGLILAANLGAFSLYALVSLLALVTAGSPGGRVLAGLGLLANLGLAGTIFWNAFAGQGLSQNAAAIALILGLAWLILSAAYYLIRRVRRS